MKRLFISSILLFCSHAYASEASDLAQRLRDQQNRAARQEAMAERLQYAPVGVYPLVRSNVNLATRGCVELSVLPKVIRARFNVSGSKLSAVSEYGTADRCLVQGYGAYTCSGTIKTKGGGSASQVISAIDQEIKVVVEMTNDKTGRSCIVEYR
jgi:hypothetical protein